MCAQIQYCTVPVVTSCTLCVCAGKGAVNRKSRWDIVVVDADSDGPGTGLELGRMVQQLKDLVEPWEKVPLLPRLVLLAQVRQGMGPCRMAQQRQTWERPEAGKRSTVQNRYSAVQYSAMGRSY